MKFFDDNRTNEILDIIRPFKDENGVGIEIYPSKTSGSKVYEYDLIGFNGKMQYMKYIFKKDTVNRPTRYIHSFADALVAVSNAKMHSMCHDFEIYIVFDDESEDVSIRFCKAVEGFDCSYRSKFQRTGEPATVEMVKTIKQIDNGGLCGIVVYATDLKENSYYVVPFDYEVVKGKFKRTLREGQTIVLKEVHCFDDLVMALSNAKAFDACRDYEMTYFTNVKNGLSSMIFCKM